MDFRRRRDLSNALESSAILTKCIVEVSCCEARGVSSSFRALRSAEGGDGVFKLLNCGLYLGRGGLSVIPGHKLKVFFAKSYQAVVSNNMFDTEILLIFQTAL